VCVEPELRGGDCDDAKPAAPFEEANEAWFLAAQRDEAPEDQFVIAGDRAVAGLKVRTRKVCGEAFAAVGEHGEDGRGQRGGVGWELQFAQRHRGSSATGWGYDRTMVVRMPRPRRVGIGVTVPGIASIQPQAHELSMHVMPAQRTL
jgi:hypothetical protein